MAKAKIQEPEEAQAAPEIAEQQGGEIATRNQNTEIELYDAGEDTGAGLEDVGMDERRLPMLRILDPKSPQCKPAAQGGIAGARGGALFNTASLQVFDGELGGEFIACARDNKYIEWLKRDDSGGGGGFVGVYEADDPKVKQLRAQHGKFGKMPMGKDAEGKEHEMAQTFSLFAIFTPYIKLADGSVVPDSENRFRCMIPFAGMQIKKYQSFIDRTDNIRYQGRLPNGEIGPVKPPLWSHRFRITTQYESRGTQSWYGYVITFAEKNPDGTEADKKQSRLGIKDPLYMEGREFFKLISEGAVKADYRQASSDDDGPVGGSGSSASGNGGKAEDIPW